MKSSGVGIIGGQVSHLTYLAILFALCSQFAWGQELPDYRGRVNDFAGVVDEAMEQKMEAVIQEVDERTSAEIAVVTVDTIQPMSIEEYANKLFEKWGVGKRGKDNGVMLIAAMKDRKVRIEVGYGLEGVITDGRAGEVLDRYVVPRFKEEDYQGGLYNGLMAISNLIASESSVELANVDSSALKTVESPSYESDTSDIVERVIWLSILGIVVAAIAGVSGRVGWLRWRRRRPRFCPRCSLRMVRLSEEEEDEYLNKVQELEEKIESVDYDVWYCSQCNNTLIEKYVSWFSSYERCPKCEGHTLKVEYREIKSPTYTSTGTGERTENCLNCYYRKSERYTIPKLERSSSSGGGFSSSSRSSSFGGGGSGGGGASRSW
ncbi:MAG: TPM domain-containing protein [bacterium]